MGLYTRRAYHIRVPEEDEYDADLTHGVCGDGEKEDNPESSVDRKIAGAERTGSQCTVSTRAVGVNLNTRNVKSPRDRQSYQTKSN